MNAAPTGVIATGCSTHQTATTGVQRRNDSSPVIQMNGRPLAARFDARFHVACITAARRTNSRARAGMTAHDESTKHTGNNQKTRGLWRASRACWAPARMPTLLKELRPTLALAFPIVVGQVSQLLIGLTDSAFIGRVGTVPLAAAAFTHGVFGIFYVVGI